MLGVNYRLYFMVKMKQQRVKWTFSRCLFSTSHEKDKESLVAEVDKTHNFGLVKPSPVRNFAKNDLQEMISAYNKPNVALFTSLLTKHIYEGRSIPRGNIYQFITTKWIDTLNEYTVGSMMWCVGQLGFDCRNSKAHEVIVSRMLKRVIRLPNINYQSLVTCMEGFAACHYTHSLILPGHSRRLLEMLSEKLCSADCHINRRYANTILLHLSGMGYLWSELPPMLQDRLLQCAFMAEVAGKSKFVRRRSDGQRAVQEDKLSFHHNITLFTLSKMGWTVSSTSDNVQRSLYDTTASILSEEVVAGSPMNTRTVSSVLTGLAAVGAVYGDLSSALQRETDRVVSMVVRTSSGKENNVQLPIINALNKLEYRWPDLPSSSRHSMHRAMTLRVNSAMSAKSFVSLLDSVARMNGEVANRVSPELLSATAAVLPAKLQEMSAVDIARTIGSLGRIRFKIKSLTAEPVHIIQAAIENNLSSMDLATTQQLLGGLVHLELQHSHLSSGLQAALHQRLLHFVSSHSSAQLSSLVFWLNRLHAPWETFDTRVLDAMFEMGKFGFLVRKLTTHRFITSDENSAIDSGALTKQNQLMRMVVDTCSEASIADCKVSRRHEDNVHFISSLMHILGTSGLQWSALSPELRSSVANAIVAYSPMFNTPLSLVLEGLVRLEVRWSDLDNIHLTLKQAIQRGLRTYDPKVRTESSSQTISAQIYNLGRMDAVWDQLPTDELERLISVHQHSFNDDETFDLLYGLSRLQVSWSKFNKQQQLTAAITKSVSAYNIHRLARTMRNIAVFCHEEQFSRHSWAMHDAVLAAYARLSESPELGEHSRRLAMYFETLQSSSPGRALIWKHLQSMPVFFTKRNVKLRVGSAVSATDRAKKLLAELSTHSPEYSVAEQFSQFNAGIFPMAMAVFLESKLVALVDSEPEVSRRGSSASNFLVLRRQIYQWRFPHVPKYNIFDSTDMQQLASDIAHPAHTSPGPSVSAAVVLDTQPHTLESGSSNNQTSFVQTDTTVKMTCNSKSQLETFVQQLSSQTQPHVLGARNSDSVNSHSSSNSSSGAGSNLSSFLSGALKGKQ